MSPSTIRARHTPEESPNSIGRDTGAETSIDGATRETANYRGKRSLVSATPFSPASSPAEAPDEIVHLVSSDGVTIEVPAAAARCSRVIATMLDQQYGWVEASERVIHFSDIPHKTLSRAVEYLTYRWKYDGVADYPPFDIAPDESLELLLVADYLDM